MEIENQDPIQEEPTIEVETQELEPQQTTEEPTATEEPPAEPEWQPNFSYKVEDDELEFDENIREFITDKEKEDFVRDLYTKAGGLDKYKTKYESLNEKVAEYQKTEQQYQEQQQVVGSLLEMVEKKDYRNFFKQMDISEEDVLKYALDIVKYQEMSPDQRQMVDQQRMVQEQNQLLERQNQQYTQQLQEQAVQARTIQLENELTRTDVSQFLSSFDSAFGKPGAFKEEVIRQGQLAWHNEGVDLPADQAVKRVMDMYGSLVNKPAQTMQQPPQQTVVNTQQAPVIPNVQASGASPAKQQIRSLDDIRKRAQALT